MRNHDEKTRDMIRSVLPSTRRGSARKDRAAARGVERTRLRRELHELCAQADPDDHEGDLGWEARSQIQWMVQGRRAADKVQPLIRWAKATVDADPELRRAPGEAQLEHFRALLPADVIGRHAVSHLQWEFDPPQWWRDLDQRPGAATPPLGDLLHEILAAGRHGELNAHLRASVPAEVKVAVPVPGGRYRRVEEGLRARRLLLGAHDVARFVADVEPRRPEARAVRSFHRSMDLPEAGPA